MSKATQVEILVTVRYRDEDFYPVGTRAQASCTARIENFEKVAKKLKKEITLDEGKKFSSVEKRKAIAERLIEEALELIPEAER